jgi:hypothetical protein
MAGPAREITAAQRCARPLTRQRGLAKRRGPLPRAAYPRTRPALGLPPVRAADEQVPLVSERNRGGRKATAVTHHRWQLRQDQGHRRVRLSLAHLGVPLIEAMAAAVEDGGGHGSSRSRFGRLWWAHGVLALTACLVSIPNPNCI